MLCETFLTDVNSNMFPLPGYQLWNGYKPRRSLYLN